MTSGPLFDYQTPFPRSGKSTKRIDKLIALRMIAMETMITIHVEQLPEGYYLATSSDVQGLVAQGRTIAETLEIARDVARRLIEAKTEQNSIESLRPVGKAFDLQVVVGC